MMSHAVVMTLQLVGDEQCWCCLHGYCWLPTTTGELALMTALVVCYNHPL